MEVMEAAAPGMPGSASDVVRAPLKRPVPDDLAKLAETYSVDRMRRHYRVGSVLMALWLKEIGWSGTQKGIYRPMPEDFPARAHERNSVLTEAYRCSESLVSRWRKECGVVMRRRPNVMPEDFAQVAWRLSAKDLMQRYGVGKNSINRWRKLVGPSPCSASGSAGRSNQGRFRVAPLPVLPSAGRDMSIGGRAADFLRKERWIVFRCTESGKADRAGDHFLVGTRVMTEDDMLQMAERKGFRAFEDISLRPSPITGTAVSL